MGKDILKISNLTKTYPGVIALDDVSLSIRIGEVHALLGENGAGKFTLIKATAGAITFDKGVIEIDGNSFTSLTPLQSQEEGMQVIYQEFNLIDS